MKHFILVQFVLAFMAMCSQNNEAKFGVTKFKTYNTEFDSLKNYIASSYISDGERLQKNRIGFYNCRINSKSYPDEICDEKLLDKMAAIGINSISIEKGLCKQNGFSEIFFVLKDPFNSKLITIVYSPYCLNQNNYSDQNINIVILKPEWYLKIEN